MSKFESKPPGQRNWLIWKSIYSVKESYYWSLIAFAFMTVMTIVVDYSVTNDTGLSIEQDGNEFAIIWLTLVPIMIFMFFVMNLAYYVEGIRFSKNTPGNI